MTIQVKTSTGIIQELSVYAFEKRFKVKYISELVIDKNWVRSSRGVSEPSFSLRKIPNENRRSFFEMQILDLKIDSSAQVAGEMKNWLYGDQIRQGRHASIYISKVSEKVGYGVFAAEDIAAGKMIGEYTGFARRWKSADGSNAYVFGYANGAVIDSSKMGNFSRFINHSEKNANARFLRVMLDDFEHVIFIAQRKISMDEQILFDYGEGYWKHRTIPELLKSKGDSEEVK